MYSGFDLNNPFVVDALAGFRMRPPVAPARPSAFQDMPAMDAMPGGVTEAPRPAASGSAPWGFIGEDQAREEISRKIQQIDAEKAAQERAIEQAKQAQAPATFWGMPVVSPEQAQYAAEQQYAETKAREKQAEAQLAGDAPLPTLTPERNFAETAYQSAGKSIANVPKFAGYIGGWLASEAGSDAAPTDNAVFGLGQNIEEWAKSSFPGDEMRSEEFGTKAANLAGFLATLYGAGGLRAMTEGGPILAEKIGRAASLGSQASLAASGGAMGQFEGATAAMEQGGDVSERDRAISTLLGAGVGLTSMIPLASSLATPAEREAGAVMAEVLKGSGVTASQMAGYNVMSNAIAKTFYDPDRALTQGLGDDLALGALAGGVTHGVSSLAKPRMSTPEEIGAFINRARSASDPSSAAYFDGMRDWVNANVPRLPAPAEGGAPAPAGAEPSPKPAPSGGLKGQEPALKEWVNDVYGDGYRGEVSPDGKTLAIVGPEGKKLITYQPEDLRMSGALRQEPPISAEDAGSSIPQGLMGFLDNMKSPSQKYKEAKIKKKHEEANASKTNVDAEKIVPEQTKVIEHFELAPHQDQLRKSIEYRLGNLEASRERMMNDPDLPKRYLDDLGISYSPMGMFLKKNDYDLDKALKKALSLDKINGEPSHIWAEWIVELQTGYDKWKKDVVDSEIDRLREKIERERAFLEHPDVTSMPDLEGVRDISEIEEDEPHPGRVRAYHGTSVDKPFQKMIVNPGAHIGLHFGTQQQAHHYNFIDEDLSDDVNQRVYPVILNMKNPIELIDTGEWAPKDIAKQLEGRIPDDVYADLNKKLDEYYGNPAKDKKKQLAEEAAVDDKGKLAYNALKIGNMNIASAKKNIHSNIYWENFEAEKKDEKVIDSLRSALEVLEDLKQKFDAVDAEYPKPLDYREASAKGQEAIRDALIEAGYDGVRYRNTYEGEGWSYIAFKPETVKSALSGSTIFSRASERELIDMARTLNAGKVVDVDPDIYGKIFADIEPVRQALPESTPVRALTKIEPREGGEGLILTFDDGAGNIARMTAGSIDDFAHLGGFCLSDGSAISFVSLSLVGKAGDGGPGSGGEIGAGDTHGGVFLHEATHALFRQQRIPADDWVRFVGHAQNLRVMDMSMTDFMKAIGEEPQPGEATIRDAYEMLYQNKPMEERDVLINEEEAVAHMMQLFHLKHYDGEQMQPIVDILYKFISGGYSGRDSNE